MYEYYKSAIIKLKNNIMLVIIERFEYLAISNTLIYNNITS